MNRSAPDSAAELHDDAMQQLQNAQPSVMSAEEQMAQPSQSQPQLQFPSRRSSAQCCNADALHCIFAFLSLKELMPALHSCRDWYAAAAKEPSRALAVRICSAAAFDSLVASSLRHHVVEMDFDFLRFRLCLGQLRQLRALPRLTALDASLDLDEAGGDTQIPPAEQPLQSLEQHTQLWRDTLPPHLRSLKLGMRSERPIAQCVRQSLFAALPTLSHLATLRLAVSTSDLDLSSLLHLTQLSDLHLREHPLPTQCDVIKQLGSLTALSVGCLYLRPDALLRLLTPPHSLPQLQRIPVPEALDPPTLALLRQLSLLTELKPDCVDPGCWSDLGAFTQLRTLVLSWPDAFTPAHLSSLESSFAALPHLSDLELSLPHHGKQDPAPPLQLRLPALRRLMLSEAALPTLAFLQRSPRLQVLFLSQCQRMEADDAVRCLQSHTPRLRHLILDYSVRLDAEQQAQLQPPSALLPALNHFECYF